MSYRIEVTGEFGGAVGGWRPAVTGTLNQTGQSDEAASTFETKIEAENVRHHISTVLHTGVSAEFRIVEVASRYCLHVTAIRNGGVYGHDCSDVGANDCGGFSERFYASVSAAQVERGHVYEIDDTGAVLAEVTS